jgi:hypothetical protein
LKRNCQPLTLYFAETILNSIHLDVCKSWVEFNSFASRLTALNFLTLLRK